MNKKKIYKTKNDDNVYKKLRIAANLGQLEVANILSITKSTVSKWECGRSIPDQAMLPKLAELYDTTTDYLLGREEKSSSSKMEELDANQQMIKNMIKKLETLPEEHLLSANIILEQFVDTVIKGNKK